MQGEHGQFLVLEPVRGDFTAFAKEDKVRCRVIEEGFVREVAEVIPAVPLVY
jgi:hypothetical protein